MEKALSLAVTVIMTVSLFLRRSRRCSAKEAGGLCTGKAWVYSAGFFTVAFYLDLICMLIVEGFQESGAGNAALDWLGVLVSKSILASVLIMGNVTNAGNGREHDIHNAVGASDTEGSGLCYMNGLTVGTTLFFLVLAAGSLWQQGSVTERFLTVLFLFAVLLLFYSFQMLYEKRQREEKKREAVLTKKREADVYLENVENSYQRTRELWHDLKNHINLLNMLLSEKKYEQMADYLRVFGEDVDSLTLPVKSGNIIVDALLADKASRAKKEGVEVSLSLCNLTGLALKPDEICGLLGNLLDNALEANRQVQAGKFIAVDCRETEDCYYIQVKNAAASMAREEGGALQTAKTDKRNRVGHGLGLRSVERIVHSCGGELAVNSREKEFTAVARLPK